MKEHKKQEDATPWKIATGIFAALFLATLFIFSTNEETVQQQAQQESAAVDMKIFANDIVKGPVTAPVTIIVYSDPSCPYCAAAAGGSEMVAYMQSRSAGYEAAVPGIIKNYVDKGKVRIVFRYYLGHGRGAEAMNIMLCANEQGKFWEVHDLFFNNQNLMNNGNAADVEGLKKLATDNGIDSGKLEACLSSNKYDAKLQNDMQLGKASGVSGTPAFAVNGKLVVGAQPFSALKAVIDAELS